MLEAYLEKVLCDRWRGYRRQMRKCRRQPSEKTVHQLRVATRRFMALFLLLDCLLPDAALAKAQRLLKRRLESLGPLRDLQVQLLYLGRRSAFYPELAEVGRTLQKRERTLMKRLSREVAEWKFRKLEKWVSVAVEELARLRGRDPSNTLATELALRHTTQAFERVVERRDGVKLDDLSTIHRTRVAFKRFRYMVEALPPELTGFPRARLRALGQYQRRMGRIQDLEVLRKLLDGLRPHDPDARFALESFRRRMDQALSRAVRVFVRSADDLFGFWPPATANTPGPH